MHSPRTSTPTISPLVGAYAILTLTTLFWGANAVAGRIAAGHISPGMLTLLRWLVALIVLLIISRPRLRADWPNLKRALPHLMLLGGLGFALFNIFLYTGLNYTTAINAAIAQGGMPVAIFLLNFVVYRLRPSLMQIVGLVLGLCGVAMVAAQGDLANLAALQINRGDALLLCAVVVYSSYTVALRAKPAALHWQSTMTGMAAGATIAALPYALWEAESGNLMMPDATAWAVVIFAAIFPSIGSQSLFIKGNELIGGNRAGLFTNLIPVWGTLLAVVVLGETFHLWQAVSLGLIFSGIALAERFKPKT
ncbi:DMT family transporter [Notoacmeibacter sp. MSK16QG-6]|uniref:DMT family transporter n=1 Tax=Notoacmeibacter sp. MSK16QG-6 TaxID=2957982 RepID=UPI00209ED824|nr:DMT family transporter [Notoacmeibacter sp. MSK16QG-6]MCP1200104.1 DMT family transporter [Notoacmeibacter sp. MSK16QG-6]